MINQFKLLDSVAILKPVLNTRLTLVEPEYASISSLPVGLVGTIVEVYDTGNDYQYLVEFADNQGIEYAMAILKEDEILVLQYELAVA
ncbi:DUF4926 domain-containing protein [Kamptonema sp. UHCC 0994]|uniref:DUF4926 domain-containing protein n=1 Tax=Kamptonema sp. UHCC 0994 TaxID=3031329 RepID=UPI0023B90C92|nr:DUF4926 domain-containing protein [Kamptonema sp. UHCC 0994]MDF0553770.1 DUF4926 domain-containing protein [Kamptonema sp. UHCC 0994]